MFVEKTIKDNNALIKVNGKIDIVNSPVFREELADVNFKELRSLTFDFEKVDYISSAGLRELIIVLKKSKGLIL